MEVTVVGEPGCEDVVEALRAAGIRVRAVASIGQWDEERDGAEGCVLVDAPTLDAVHSAREEFAGVLSHEINTPLTVILGYATTLVGHWDEVPDDDKLAFVDAIRRRARQVARLVDQNVTLYHFDQGAVRPRRHRVAVLEVIKRAVEGQPDDDIEVSVSCPPDLMAGADGDLVAMVLSTFVDNAITYGRPPFEVIAREVGAGVEIRVADSGPGVPDEFVPHLFDRFSQASTGTTRTARGIGLGLSLAQSFARLQGGDVWYEKRAPWGSCFGLRLPASLTLVPLTARLVSDASEMAVNGAQTDEAVAELLITAGGDEAAMEEARQRCLRLGFTLPSCRRAARLLALAAAEVG